VQYCTGTESDRRYNTVGVMLAPQVTPPDPSLERAFAGDMYVCAYRRADAAVTRRRT
jgi:hypothetical protein